MKTKKLIEELQKCDPTGEEEVCIGNVDIHFIEKLPAYYDGTLQVLIRDEKKSPYYNIVGAKYKRTGKKIVIHYHSISDAICDNPNLPIDYSELSEERQVKAKIAHDELKQMYLNLEVEMKREHFVEWAKLNALKITEDIEEIKDMASEFFNKNVSPNDKYMDGGIPSGESYISMRQKQWDNLYEVVLDQGFLEIKHK